MSGFVVWYIDRLKYCMNTFFKIIATIVVVVSLGGVFVSYASADTNGLVPCGNGVPTAGSTQWADECTICFLQQLAIKVMKWFITIAVVVATALFVNAGVLYVLSPSNPGNIAKAHHLFFATLIGMIVIFSAWMIVNTIMVVLYNDTFGVWNGIMCSEGTTGGGFVSNTGGGGGGNSTTNPPNSNGSPWTDTNGVLHYDDTTARQRLAAVGIDVNHPDPQTSLQGVREDTLGAVIQMQREANTLGYFTNGGHMTVTGGTEDLAHASGQYSHVNGYKLDLRLNNGTNNYIENSGAWTRVEDRGGAHGGARYQRIITTENGHRVQVTAVREGNHWDVSFIPAS